jgi:hypothetical protein
LSSPAGFLGVNWGDDADSAAARLGLHCAAWAAWEGEHGYEACFDTNHPVAAFGRTAFVRLFRQQQRLEGLSLRFMHCGATRAELAAAVRQEFALPESDELPYHVFADGAAVHLAYDSSDDSCTLTSAGPRFGRAFAAYQLERGFKGLAHGLRPH